MCRIVLGGTPSISRTMDFPYARSTITITGAPDTSTFAACFARIETICRAMDMFNADSEISAVTCAAGRHPVAASADVLEVMRQGLSLAQTTGGRFDPTVGPLVKLWGIGGNSPRVPALEEIRSALRLVDWKRVAVDDSAGTIFLEKTGMALDFGSLVKGYAAVETGRVLSSRGITSAIVDIGGSVLALGLSSKGSPWSVGLQEPGAAPARSWASFLPGMRWSIRQVSTRVSSLRTGKGIPTSWIHVRGTPWTTEWRPSQSSLPGSHNADGPALSILALGAEKGLALASRLGIDAVVIGADRTLRMTDGARGGFQLLDHSYKIVR